MQCGEQHSTHLEVEKKGKERVGQLVHLLPLAKLTPLLEISSFLYRFSYVVHIDYFCLLKFSFSCNVSSFWLIKTSAYTAL